jgi:hypothetical protein
MIETTGEVTGGAFHTPEFRSLLWFPDDRDHRGGAGVISTLEAGLIAPEVQARLIFCRTQHVEQT